VVGAANFLGPALAAIFDRVQAGDLAAAQSSWAAIFAMMKALSGASAYVQGVKGAMRIAGYPVGDPRAPIQPLGGARARQFEALLNGIDREMLTGK
jgi:4-hydroxy-tetrahydrodipicolinate synthase